MTKEKIEEIQNVIARLRHPMANEHAMHDGVTCQQDRDAAARLLQEFLPAEGTADGSTR